MRSGFLSALTLLGTITATPAIACGFEPSQSAELREHMHQKDREAIRNGDAVVEATLVHREGGRVDMIFYNFEPTTVVTGSVRTQVLQSRRGLETSCGPLPYLYLDWDDDALMGAAVVLLVRIGEDGTPQVVQAARTETPDGRNMLEAARSRPTGN